MTGTKTGDASDRKIAMLIDGDNAQPRIIERMIREAERYGSVTTRRIYGDWTTPAMNGWKESLHKHAIQPVQQFRYTVGKNSTDSALIIDAMDILHTGTVSGFCLISSDSDYTRLATRIREGGTFVIGIGQKKTPEAFVKACDVFVYTENLDPGARDSTASSSSGRGRGSGKGKGKARGKRESEAEVLDEPDPIPLLREAFSMTLKEDLWVDLSELGSALSKIDPGFDPRTYGHRTLSHLFKAYPKLFEMRYEEEVGHSKVWVRLLA
ncbi:MAG: NYN domain-containing protein [Thermoplasmata archaeon]|nr:NYN domain-containing protein [Thermoplasmata archaeon]